MRVARWFLIPHANVTTHKQSSPHQITATAQTTKAHTSTSAQIINSILIPFPPWSIPRCRLCKLFPLFLPFFGVTSLTNKQTQGLHTLLPPLNDGLTHRPETLLLSVFVLIGKAIITYLPHNPLHGRPHHHNLHHLRSIGSSLCKRFHGQIRAIAMNHLAGFIDLKQNLFNEWYMNSFMLVFMSFAHIIAWSASVALLYHLLIPCLSILSRSVLQLFRLRYKTCLWQDLCCGLWLENFALSD